MKTTSRIFLSLFLSFILIFNPAFAQERAADHTLASTINLEALENKPAANLPAAPADFFAEPSPLSYSDSGTHNNRDVFEMAQEGSANLTAEEGATASSIPTYNKWPSETVTWGINYTSIEQYYQTQTATTVEHKKVGFFQTIKQAFTEWAKYIPLTFQEVAVNTAQIMFTVLSGQEFDANLGTPNDAIAYAYFPQGGDVYLDGARQYTLPAVVTGGVSYSAITTGIDILTVYVHEIGHSLGIGHAETDGTSVMYPYLNGPRTVIAPEDPAVPAVRSLYGAGTGRVITIAPPPSDFIGVTTGATVNGTVNIGPNLNLHPDVRKAAYYLNGVKSGKVYSSPFYWGGVNGTGISGFDTRTLANGNHTLSMTYTDSTGDHTAEINFNVDNPVTTVQPTLNGIAADGAVSGNIFVSPDAATFGPIQRAEYFVDGVSKGISTVAPFTWGGTQGFDTKTLSNGAHVLRAVIIDNAGPHEISFNFSVNNSAEPPAGADFVGVTNGATLNGIVNIGPNLNLHPNVRKAVYYLNGSQSGKYYASPFTWGGSGGFDTKTLPDGSHTLSMTYTDNTGDHTAIVNFNVNNTAGVQPKLNGLAAGATVSGSINVAPDPATFGAIQRAEYFVDGSSKGISTVAPFTWGDTQGFDTKALSNGAHVLRAVVTDNTGAHEITVNFTVNNSSAPPAADFTGVAEGAVLTGTVNAGPNLNAHPGIRKVAYYLNGSQSGKYYSSPFTWGGSGGFDTRTLPNGNHTLSMTYTDSTGDHTATVSFTVNN